MRVRLTSDRYCSLRGVQFNGQIVDLPDREAHQLLRHNQAEVIEPQTATRAAVEAAIRHPKRR